MNVNRSGKSHAAARKAMFEQAKELRMRFEQEKLRTPNAARFHGRNVPLPAEVYDEILMLRMQVERLHILLHNVMVEMSEL